jgi:serine phosphatase RsbU (regulator of sigma subunit)
MTSDDNEDATEHTVIRRAPVFQAPAEEIGHFLTYAIADEVTRVPITRAGLTIGRTAPSDVLISTAEISRRHCRIELAGDEAMLSDLGSTNGTFINGERLQQPQRLRNGSQFSLGSFLLRYERRSLRELADEAALAADLKRAEEYVRAILPLPISTGPVRADWCFVPSSQLGGDAFGYQFLDDDNFCGFVLDVSGHGIGSAMHAANVANTLRRRALPGVDFHDPEQVARGVNAVFPMEEHNGLMLTLWYFTYNLPSRRLRFCAAGHHAAFLITPEAPEPAPLWLRGPAIGMLPFGKWAAGSTEMPPGSRLYVFSDGAFEIVTAAGQQWALEDFRGIVAGAVVPGTPEPQRLYGQVRAAARPGPLDDDFSVLVVSFD